MRINYHNGLKNLNNVKVLTLGAGWPYISTARRFADRARDILKVSPMSSGAKIATDQQARKWKWVRPILTVIFLITVLILLTDGEILEPFVYSKF